MRGNANIFSSHQSASDNTTLLVLLCAPSEDGLSSTIVVEWRRIYTSTTTHLLVLSCKADQPRSTYCRCPRCSCWPPHCTPYLCIFPVIFLCKDAHHQLCVSLQFEPQSWRETAVKEADRPTVSNDIFHRVYALMRCIGRPHPNPLKLKKKQIIPPLPVPLGSEGIDFSDTCHPFSSKHSHVFRSSASPARRRQPKPPQPRLPPQNQQQQQRRPPANPPAA